MTMELEFERDTIVCYETLTEVTLCQEETLESIGSGRWLGYSADRGCVRSGYTQL